ncbi:MAG: hypothetical protein JOY99_00310 [Sphingomonadaceae bacterium]|nr:hypothetical protein [Sphingomonadaceae bacterium]
MKLSHLIATGGIAIAALAMPASAQRGAHTETTVTPVHGPLKILPHHNRKICKTRWVHHRRVSKCWYH